MRLKAVLLVATGVALALSVVASEPAPRPLAGTEPQAEEATVVPHVDFREGAVSTCVAWPLAKKRIILTPNGHNGCRVHMVVPPLVCVLQGGVIRWEVLNNCQPLEADDDQPALKITNLREVLEDGSTKPADWLDACEPQFEQLETGLSAPLFCDVPPGTDEKLYKYDIEGREVETLDPWIEVRRGG